MKRFVWFLVIMIAVFSLWSCSKKGKKEKFLNGAGASFPYPLYATWANEYYKLTGVKINYQSIGSGGGIQQIIKRTVDFGASDRPLPPQEVEKYKLLQFPTVIGAIVPVVNIPELKGKHLVLDGETLCEIYLGKIKKWNDPKIAKLNPGIKLPDKKITPVYRADGSGTTAIFTHYLSQACAEWKKEIGYGTAVHWKVGIGAKGNEGVSNYVKQTPYSIGYVEYAYAFQNHLNFVTMKNKAGKVVYPSEDSIKAAARTGNLDPSKHFYVWLTDAPGKNAWPIVGATYILLARERKQVDKEVVKFFDWAYSHGDKIAEKLTYVPLPKEVKQKIRAYWKKYGIY
ncbi:MAG: phosphate ABC transporter substrate-binding protein PstS [Thermodesulfobacteria bacterium]|nr:phosphate ABC transporter substrate-binding protein PstS [Thermodesulfobacteriota bacterium]